MKKKIQTSSLTMRIFHSLFKWSKMFVSNWISETWQWQDRNRKSSPCKSGYQTACRKQISMTAGHRCSKRASHKTSKPLLKASKYISPKGSLLKIFFSCSLQLQACVCTSEGMFSISSILWRFGFHSFYSYFSSWQKWDSISREINF